MPGCCSRRVLIISFAFTGIVLLVVGLVLSVGGVFSNIIKNKVDQNVELKPGGLVYKEWVNTTIPVYMQYFVFDLKNPEEVFAGTAIPTVEQKGPYSYREIRSNEVLNWTSDKSIVTFMPNRTYMFDPETSCAGCDDKKDFFVSVNIPLLTMALWLKNTNYKMKHGFCFFGLEVEANRLKVKLFQNRTVFDILWGYTDPFLEFIISASKLCPGRDGLSAFVQLQYNNTYFGISAVNTGRTDISKLEQYTMWREEPHLSWWSDKYANMINGTDGTQFSPGVTKDDTLYAFSPEVCRSFYFVFDSEVTVRDIKLYRFTAPDEIYKSGDVYPPNKGFCVPPHCLPSGLLNISRCQPLNPPVVISPPHFYQGNKSLVKAVRGLHPTKSADETYVDVEPITGIVMRVAKRIQINIALEPVDILAQTNGKFKPVFLPVMFANESALISEDKAADFRHQVYLAITLTEVVEYGLIALGILFILVALVLFILTVRKKNGLEMCITAGGDDERKPLVNDGNKVYT
ncbi:CD36 [Desmophyllum pertusum]|uniref:CD36 n=1 Tax=Desmophyllum pertusum TaxID=174260 RepID=A0A9X0A4P1_9CNID|nr:CD36 [Desmophyllum pertusum]